MLSDGRLYTGYLKRVTRSLGVHTYLARCYWGLSIPRILYTLSSQSTVDHQIGDMTVTFPIEEYWQYQRFRWMHPEIQLFESLLEELEPGDVFYDVGAHLGWHTVVAASISDAVEVCAFEPHPTIATRLETVIEATGHDVSLYDVALHEKTEPVEFVADPTPAAHVSGTYGDELTDSITVEAVAGDQLVAAGTLEAPDILKIDAEGAERAVLAGLRETITSHRPRVIYCEIHHEKAAVVELLAELGYTTEPFPSARPLLKAVPQQ